MRESPVGFLLLGIGVLGGVGWLSTNFHPSTGLKVVGAVMAVTAAVWTSKAHPAPEEAYSPLHGRRVLRTTMSTMPYSPMWLMIPVALATAWLFTVYGAGMSLAFAVGTDHTRQGQVAYSVDGTDTTRARRSRWLTGARRHCTRVTVELQAANGTKRIVYCDDYLGGVVLPPGFPVTYHTRESPLGMFVDLATRFR